MSLVNQKIRTNESKNSNKGLFKNNNKFLTKIKIRNRMLIKLISRVVKFINFLNLEANY